MPASDTIFRDVSRWSLMVTPTSAAAAPAQCAPLPSLDPGVRDHLAPIVELNLDVAAELVRRRGERLEADGLELRLDVRVVDDLAQLAVEPSDDLRRGARRCNDAGPRIEIEAGHAGLVHGRQIGEQRAALQPRHRQRP